MERIEDLLHDEFQRADGALATTRDAMLARVAKVRRRRTAAVGLAAVAMMAIAAAAAMPLLGRSGTQSGGGAGLPRHLYSNQLVNVVFTDHDHGFVVQQRCTMLNPDDLDAPAPDATPDVHHECQSHLLVTADAGHSWQERALPAEPASKDAGPGVELLFGHSLMLWVDGPGRVALGSWHQRYWTTTDGGRTWSESAMPRELGPAGSVTVFGPDDSPAFLATNPPGPDTIGSKNPVVAASDGSFWVACVSSPCVQVTHDRGQTWQTLSTGGAGTAGNWMATSDGQTVYTSVRDGAGSRLLRSTDAGVTWTEVPQASGLPGRGAAALALPNGDLIMTLASEEGGVYRLKAGAMTPERLAGAPAHANALYRTGGWIVAVPAWNQRDEPDLGSAVSLSPDNGTTWIAVPAPPPA